MEFNTVLGYSQYTQHERNNTSMRMTSLPTDIGWTSLRTSASQRNFVRN